MDKITTVGLDLAKSVFSLHGVDASGRTVLRKTVRRDQQMELVAATGRHASSAWRPVAVPANGHGSSSDMAIESES